MTEKATMFSLGAQTVLLIVGLCLTSDCLVNGDSSRYREVPPRNRGYGINRDFGTDRASHGFHGGTDVRSRSNRVDEMLPSDQLLVMNEFLDATLCEIRKSPQLREVLEPLRLDRYPVHFKNGVIHDIQIKGLLSLRRRGNVSILADEGVLLADLAVDDLGIFFQYKFSPFSLITFEGRFDGSFERLAIVLNIKLSEHMSELLLFKVVEVGHCRVHKFTGASVAFNWAVRKALQIAINANRDRIARKIERVLRPIIQEKLREVSLENIIANIIH